MNVQQTNIVLVVDCMKEAVLHALFSYLVGTLVGTRSGAGMTARHRRARHHLLGTVTQEWV